MVGGRDVLVEHPVAARRGQEQPGVSGLAADHQQQGQPDALEQQGPLPAGAAGDREDSAAEDHPERAVAVEVAGRLDVEHPAGQREEDVQAERGAEREEPLPPGEHHQHQRHARVEQTARLGGQDQLAQLVGDRSSQAVVAGGDLQRHEECEGRGACHDPQDLYSRKHRQRYVYQLFDRFIYIG